MSTLRAYRYDGNSSKRLPVNLQFTPSGIYVSGDGLAQQYTYADVTLQPKMAGVVTQLRFADGSQCDVEDQPNLDVALANISGQAGNRLIHKLENNLLYIVLAVVLSVAVLFGIVQYAVPMMAREVAYRMPPEIESGMGSESLKLIDHMMQPSQLSVTRQTELRIQFQQLADDADVRLHSILFRKGGDIGANAFALPSGIIVLTDELVAMSQDDRELMAVFAHELGHVKYRHTMQHVLQSSVTGLLIVFMTGDASSVVAALPAMLLQTKYSRDFEAEADDFSIALLTLNGIPPSLLGDILHRMEKNAGVNNVPDFLSTHPATDKRVRKFNGAQHAESTGD